MKTILSSGRFFKPAGQVGSQQRKMAIAWTDFLVQDASTIWNLVGLSSTLPYYLAVHLPRFSGSTDSERHRNK